jgi:hypothetical protein
LSRTFHPLRETKPPMFPFFFWSTSASLAASLWVRPLGLFGCYGFALQHISLRQPILPLTTVLSRVCENFSHTCFSLIRAGRPSEFCYLAFIGLPRRANTLCYSQRAGLYRDQ